MNYDIFLTDDAEADILDIWKYVAHHDSVERAATASAIILSTESNSSSIEKRRLW